MLASSASEGRVRCFVRRSLIRASFHPGLRRIRCPSSCTSRQPLHDILHTRERFTATIVFLYTLELKQPLYERCYISLHKNTDSIEALMVDTAIYFNVFVCLAINPNLQAHASFVNPSCTKTDANYKDLKSLANDLNLEIVQFRPHLWIGPRFKFGQFTNLDPKLRQAALDLAKRTTNIAQQMEAHLMVYWPA